MDEIPVRLLQESLDAIEAEIAKAVGDRIEKRDALVEAIKQLGRRKGSKKTSTGDGAAAPAVEDDVLVDTVRELTAEADEGAVKAKQIAEALEVDTRSIARKLAKLVTEGLLAGDKTAGYSIA